MYKEAARPALSLSVRAGCKYCLRPWVYYGARWIIDRRMDGCGWDSKAAMRHRVRRCDACGAKNVRGGICAVRIGCNEGVTKCV